MDVRARVSGYITKVAFDAGARVKQGDLLFEIDPREYRPPSTGPRGTSLGCAPTSRARARSGAHAAPAPSGAVSEREVDTATGSKGATEGELVAAQAQLEQAKLDLEFTKLPRRSPGG